MKKISEWPKWGRITFYVFVAFLVLICPFLIIPLVAWWVIRRYLRWSAGNRLAESAARLEKGAAPTKTPFLPRKPKEIAITIVCALGFIGICINSCSDSSKASSYDVCKGDAKIVEESIDDFPIDQEKILKVKHDALACGKVNELHIVEKRGGEEDAKRFAKLKEAADKEDVDAQFKVAICYVDGIGTPVDYEKAYQYAKMSANRSEEGKCLMASLAYDGFGDKEMSKQDAVKCFEKGAEANVVFAQCLSGHYSTEWRTRERNLLSAIKAGSKMAKFELARWGASCYRRDRNERFPIPPKEVIEEIGTLAMANYVPALLESGEWFVDDSMRNFGIEANLQMAEETFVRAAKQGSAKAAYEIAKLYLGEKCIAGKWVEKDIMKVWRWLRITKALGWTTDLYYTMQSRVEVLKSYRVKRVNGAELYEFALGRGRPTEGCAYAHYGMGLEVFQKVGHKTYTVRYGFQDAPETMKFIAVRTAKELKVGTELPSGVFVCIGSFEYENLRGMEISVPLFEEAKRR